MLEWTGERYLPYINPEISGVEIHYEHLHRYAFASQFVKGKKVLDLACGEGYGSFILSKNAKSVVGIDIDPVAISHAANTYSQENIRFIEGSILNIPIPEEKSFDVIVCFEAIEHVTEHDILLQEIRRLLNDDGILIISTPDKVHYSEETGYHNPFHLKELHRAEFCELLQKYFSNIYLSGQQIVSGSSIFPLSGYHEPLSSKFNIEYSDSGFSFIEEGKEGPCRYFIAIASTTKLDTHLVQNSYLVDKSNAEIAFLTDRINKDNVRIQSLESIVSGKEDEVLKAQHLIESLEPRLTTKKKLIIEYEQKIQSLESDLSVKDNQILRIQESVHSLESDLVIKNNLILESQDLIQSLGSKIAEMDSSLQNCKIYERSLEEKTTKLDQTLNIVNFQLNNQEKLIKSKDSEIVLLNSRLKNALDEIQSLKSSATFQVLEKFQRKIIDPLFPHGTRRRERYDFGLKGCRVLISQGIGKTWEGYKRYCSTGQYVQEPVHISPPLSQSQTAPAPAVAITGPGLDAQTVIHLHDRNHQKSSEYVLHSRDPLSLSEKDIRCIAFYLPQFHPIPENDQWWGKGFTEWTNVSKALPQFIGHYQPHLPDELGFYDLRLPEIQKRQIELARHYGIYGFCFYYYWFNGKRLLERPLNQFLEHKDWDFPFCICWANENWTRRWDGMEHEILMSQVHSRENDVNFIRDVEPLLRDPRYIRINGKPLLMVYRAGLLPDAKETTRRWREYCRTCGIGEIYLVSALAFRCKNPEEFGFDAAVEFPPHTMDNCTTITEKMQLLNQQFSGIVYDFRDYVKTKKFRKNYPFHCFRCVSPGWDNTARRQNSPAIFFGADPDTYKEWLSDVVRETKKNNPPEEQIVFINAWNEWAEGTHLEPDRKFGYGYLQATADVIQETRDTSGSEKKKIILVSHDAHLHGAQMLALHIARVLKEQFHYEVHLLLKSGGRLEDDFRKYAIVYNLERDYPDPGSLDNLLTSLCRDGIAVAICNTVVTGDLVELLARRNIRTISLVHELPGVIRQFGQEENVKKITRSADLVIFPSAFVMEKFIDLTAIDKAKCVVRPQGLFLKNTFRDDRESAKRQLRQILSLPEKSRIILNVGYADQRKGIDLFVEVACRILRDHKDVWFVWVGLRDEPFVAPVLNTINHSGLAERILFPGIRRDDIDIFYSGADIFLLTSREDPFPSVVLDAMNTRLPVIGFDEAGGFRDIVTEDTGILVPYLSVDAMTGAVSSLLKDPQEQARLGNNAADLIERKFSFPDYIYDLLGFLGHEYKKTSVILPSYNYAHYLPGRLGCIFSQTYPVYEIIAIDDHSQDRSVDVLRDAVKRSPVPFRIIVNQENSGSVFRQWAKGIALSRGDFIWIAEADDLSDPRFLEEVMKGFSDETVVLSFSQSRQIDEYGETLAPNYYDYTNDVDPDKWQQDYIRPGIDEISDSLAIKNTIPNVSAVVFVKKDISGIVEDLVRFKVAGDWYFYIWLLKNGSITYHAESLNLHRRHQKSVTTSENAQRHFNEIVEVQNNIMDNFTVSPDTRKKVLGYRENVHRFLFP